MSNVAQTILQQLGGQRFVVMTGAKNLVSDSQREGGSLMMKLPKMLTRGNITHVRITLTYNDTYTLEVFKYRSLECALHHTMDGIHADQLQTAFTAATGLDTHL